MGATAAAATRAKRSTRGAASAVGGSRTAHIVARGGLVARAAFYLLLAYLTARVAADGGTRSSGHQTNAHGALSLIAGSLPGKVAIAATALGFLVLGIVRLAGSIRDREASVWRRVGTALHGLFYVALTSVPLSFLMGRHQTGSEQQQHTLAARLLTWPGGRELVVAIGVVVIVVCAVQLWVGVREDFMDSLDLRGASRRLRRVVRASGVVGMMSRALVFVPIGVFLIIAAVQFDPRHADGLDRELATLAGRSWWGPAVLALVALGLVVFASYTLFEARYRKVGTSE
jgi:hypothetical protein